MPIKHRIKGSRDTARTPVLPVLKIWIRNSLKHNVGRNAAALAYYMLFALFPFLIFLSNLLGLLDFNISAVSQSLQRFMPADAVGIIESYLQYASETTNMPLMWFALGFAIWFPMRAAKGIMDSVRLAYELGKPARPVRYVIKQLIYTILLFLVIALTLIFSTFGKRVLEFLYDYIPASMIPFSQFMIGLWHYLRFVPIGIMMFAALGLLYQWALDQHQTLLQIRPGILLALCGWMLASVGFSFYVENFANYSIIYGTLGAVMVLLVWLYMTGIILILGAELNAALMTVKSTTELPQIDPPQELSGEMTDEQNLT